MAWVQPCNKIASCFAGITSSSLGCPLTIQTTRYNISSTHPKHNNLSPTSTAHMALPTHIAAAPHVPPSVPPSVNHQPYSSPSKRDNLDAGRSLEPPYTGPFLGWGYTEEGLKKRSLWGHLASIEEGPKARALIQGQKGDCLQARASFCYEIDHLPCSSAMAG